MPITDLKKHSVQSRLASDPVVKRCLETARREQARFQEEYDKHLLSLDATQAKRALQGELDKASNADAIAALQAAIASYENPKAQSHKDAHDRSASVICKASVAMVEANRELLHAALVAMEALTEEAIGDETQLHEAYGLKRQETAVYRRLVDCKKRLADFAESVNSPGPMRPALNGNRWHPARNHQNFVLAWFAGDFPE